MRIRKILGLLIPLGTLVGLGINYSVRKIGAEPDDALELPARARANFPELNAAVRARTLEGSVLDAQGRPIPEALILARGGDIPAWAYTNKDGRFRMEGVPDGELRAHVVALAHAPRTVSIDAQATDVVLRLERAYGPAPAVDKRVPGSLKGQVTSDGSTRLSAADARGMEVLLIPLNPERIDGPLPARARVNESGGFEFPVLFPGAYGVRVVPAWAQAAGSPDLLQSLAGKTSAAELEFQPGQEPLVLDLALGGWELELRDARGGPVEGAMALLRLEEPSRTAWPATSSDALGRVGFQQLPAGVYMLELSAGDWRMTRNIRLQADQFLRETVTMESAGEAKR